MPALVMLLGLAVLIGPAVLVAWLFTRNLRKQIDALQTRLAAQEAATRNLVQKPAGDTAASQDGATPGAMDPEPVQPAAPEHVGAEAPATPPVDDTTVTEPAADDAGDKEPSAEESATPNAVPPTATGWRHGAAATATTPARRAESLEEALGTRWFVWIGSLTLTLAAVFLVRYGIENELLPPLVRIALGVLLGAGLIAASLWLHFHPLQRAIARVGPNQVPSALGAAGVTALFASVYAGHALYTLYPTSLAFGVLAGIAFLSIGLALLLGPLVAVLGILAAYALPMLVSSDTPNPAILFGYLTAVALAGLWTCRHRRWEFMGHAALAGSSLWAVLWMLTQGPASSALEVGLFLAAILGLGVFQAQGVIRQSPDAAPDTDTTPPPIGPIGAEALTSPPHRLALAALTLALALSVALAQWADYDLAGILTVFAMLAAGIGLALAAPRLEIALIPSALAALAVLATWRERSLLDIADTETGWAPSWQSLIDPLPAATDTVFVRAAAVVLLGFWALGLRPPRHCHRPELWALASAVVPLGVLLIGNGRLEDSGLAIAWAAVSLIVAVGHAALVTRLAPLREHRPTEIALGLQTLATLAVLLFGGLVTLTSAWLPLFVTGVLVAATLVDVRMSLPFLKPVLTVVASILLARQALRGLAWMLDPALGVESRAAALDDVIQGLLPVAIGFAGIVWHRRGDPDELLTRVLRAGAWALGLLAVAVALRYSLALIPGEPAGYSALDQSLNSALWFLAGILLLRRATSLAEPNARIALALLGAASLQAVLLQALAFNPVLTGDPVGSWPLVNQLPLQFGIPALAFAWLARNPGGLLPAKSHPLLSAMAALAGLFLFALVTLEVRQLFHGSNLSALVIRDDENIAYSVLWLAFGAATIAAGFVRRRLALRQAGMGLLVVVLLKVFLWDMSALDGLYRVGSFLGLGLSLLGVSFLYQRLIFAGRPGDPEPEDGPESPGPESPGPQK